MDVWAVNLKSGGLALGSRTVEEGVNGVGFGFKQVSEVRVKRLSFEYRALVVTATGKKKNRDNPSSSGNNDPQVPQGDSSEGVDPVYDESKSDNSHNPLLDWRDFRANLVVRGHELLDSSNSKPSQKLGPKWAHPIPFPEPGCVLVATEKLDGVSSFERTVVLLLRLGKRDPREGPFGVIINRPLRKKIKHMNPSNIDLATSFAECSVHFGGPLDTSMFLIKTGDGSSVTGFEPVVPGICFGVRNGLEEAAKLLKEGVLKAENFSFFAGYAGWQLDQLKEEIASGYWVVSACSSCLMGGGGSVDSSAGLWEEILQLMGGQYDELSQKPKQDSSD